MSSAALSDDKVLKAVIKWFKKTPIAGLWGAKPDHWLLLEEYPDGCEYVRQWVRVDPAKTYFAGTVTAEAMGGGVVQTVEENGKITSIVWLENPIESWCDKNDPCQWWPTAPAEPEVRTKFLSKAAILKNLVDWFTRDPEDPDSRIGMKVEEWDEISSWKPAPGFKHREFIRPCVVDGGVVCSTECPDGSMYFEWSSIPGNRSTSAKPKPETPKPAGWGEFA